MAALELHERNADETAALLSSPNKSLNLVSWVKTYTYLDRYVIYLQKEVWYSYKKIYYILTKKNTYLDRYVDKVMLTNCLFAWGADPGASMLAKATLNRL